jgi:hypothetical protein
MSINVTPLTGTTGARVDGIDLNRPLDNDTFAALLMAFMGVDASDQEYTAAAEAARRGKGMQQCMTVSHRDWVRLDRHRLALGEQWRRTFEHWDVVVCPAAPCTAFAHDVRPFHERTLFVDHVEVSYEKLPCWSSLATPNGLPVTVVPIGADAAGSPSACSSSVRPWRITRRSRWPISWNGNWVVDSDRRLSIDELNDLDQALLCRDALKRNAFTTSLKAGEGCRLLG